MLYFLSSFDGFQLRLREQTLRAAFRTKNPSAEEHVFDGRDGWSAGWGSQLLEARSGGLFAAPRIILLRHIELFDGSAEEALQKILGETSLPTDVLCIASLELAGRAKKATPLQTWFAKNATVEKMEALSGANLTRFAEDLLQGVHPERTIEPRALTLLSSRMEENSGYIYHELWKLALTVPGNTITVKDVETLVSEPAGESVAFTALDALVRGQRERAIALLRQEETGDDAIFKLFGLFAWQIRQALMVKDEYERGVMSPDAIAKNIGAKPFSVQKLLPLLRSLPLSRLKRALAYLADLDRSIKTGEIRPGIALDLFVWKF